MDLNEKLPETVLDINPTYFRIVEGRPHRKKFLVDKYINQARETMKTRLIVQLKKRELAKVDSILLQKYTHFKAVEDKFHHYEKTFDDHVQENSRLATEALKSAENEKCITAQKSKTIEKLNWTIKALVYTIDKAETTFRTLKLYQKFLFLISPMEWRKNYDYINRDATDTGYIHHEYTSVIDPYLQEEEQRKDVLDNLDFLKKYENYTPQPELYFTEPIQLLQIFSHVDMWNVSLHAHVKESEIMLSKVEKCTTILQANIEEDMQDLKHDIMNVENQIAWSELRAKELEELFRLYIYTADDKLQEDSLYRKAKKRIQEIYETLIPQDKSGKNIIQMLSAIELKFLELAKNIEFYSADKIQEAKNDLQAVKRFTMQQEIKNTKEARRKERLEKHKESALAKPKKMMGKKLVFRSQPPRDIPEVEEPEKGLSKEEEQHLYFFVRV